MAVKPVKFNLESYEYDILKQMRSSEKELRQEYSRLRSIARKRLERLAGSDYAGSQTYLRYRNMFIPLTEIKKGSVARVSKKLTELHNFLSLETSTVSGAREVSNQRIKDLQAKGYTFIKTEKDLRKFGEFMDYNRSLKKGGLYDSEKVIEMLDKTSERGISMKQVEKDFTFWMENFEHLDEVPPMKGRRSAAAWKQALLGL